VVEAAEQPKAEPLLEKLHLMADGGLGDVELVGRAGEVEVPRRRLEGAQGVEWGQVALHGSGVRVCGRISKEAAVPRPYLANIFRARNKIGSVALKNLACRKPRPAIRRAAARCCDKRGARRR